MAIDYKVEWEKLSDKYGCCGVNIPHEAVSVTLRSIMENQINNTIEIREGLMQEYVRAQIGTEIIGADGGYHKVKLEVFGESRGTVPISKNAFNTWLRNRNKKKGGN